MKKYVFISAIVMSCVFCFGQSSKEIEIINKDCPPLNAASFLVDEITVSDKEITEYLKLKCPKNFNNSAAIEFNLIFLPNTQPCCRRTVIVDPAKITKVQKDTLVKPRLCNRIRSEP